MKQCTYLLLLSLMLCPLVFGKSLKDFTQCNFTKLCDNSLPKGNDVSEFDLLQCILYDKFTALNPECQSNVFEYARNYVASKNLRRLFSSCQEELKTLECKSEEKLIFCILNQKEKITEHYCANLVVRLERLIHAHFSLVSDYIRVCENDVKRLCGYRQIETLQLFPKEDDIVDCLQKNIDSVGNSICKQNILQISEVQGESVSLDDKLSSACAQDRKSFCSHLPPTSNTTSAVLKCLEKFINFPEFSSQCRNEIMKKEKLVSKDVKVSKGLMKACRDDIRNNHCRRLISDDKTVRLAQMLLCLQNAVRNGTKVSSDCRSEMVRHKKLLLEDYTLSPEIMSKCSADVSIFCNGLKKNGETIHCLFEHSRLRKNSDKIVSAACQRSLEELLKTVGASENWKVDPVLRVSCGAAVRNLCDDVRGDDTKVMSCLMDNINSNAESMTPECTKAVLQIQYFVSRNYKLDAQLFDACHKDAVTFCHAKNAWNDDFDSTDPERGPLILPCLFKYAYEIKHDSSEEQVKLKPTCVKQVRRVMRQRAIRADLIPEVEEMCFDELSTLCTDKVGPGQEMLCLQDNYSRLQLKCRYVVGNFTEAEASDINLNPIVKTYCKPVINDLCKDEMRRLKNESSDVMSCLIKHKNDEEMKLHYKCRAAIEHFQLISLNDYHFTVAFKNACRPYVIHYCPKAHTKAQVVECLSEVTQNDTLKDERYKLSRECRYQLRGQLLQQREFIDLDPKLKSACEKDIRVYCDVNKNHNAEILECLEENLKNLETPCRSIIFRIQQQDFRDSSTDYTLLHSCKEMIKSYCKGNVSQALVCLKRFKNDPLFDSNCRSVVLKRMIEQSADYRLNPVLQRGCNVDIRKFCFSVLKNHSHDTELQGKVLKCLTIKFREGKLRKECEVQLVSVLKESAMNYKLNPLLRNLCSNEITSFCGNEVALEKVDNSGQVEECLKVAFWRGDITARPCRLEVAGLIEEAKADIHVDPLLQRACALDVTKYCVDVPPGAGRILQCLLNVMDSKKNLLQSICKSKLRQRIEMFKFADKAENQEISNIRELAYQLNQSSSGRYVAIILLSFVGIVFILGLYCGRVSRKYTALKNK